LINYIHFAFTFSVNLREARLYLIQWLNTSL